MSSAATMAGSCVVGHGVDLVEIAEFRKLVDKSEKHFLPRCFSEAELNEIGEGVDRIERMAARFASKEAVLKALGTGFGNGTAFTDVIISRLEGGPPKVTLSGGALTVAEKNGVAGWVLSISHTSTMAFASAIATRGCSCCTT